MQEWRASIASRWYTWPLARSRKKEERGSIHCAPHLVSKSRSRDHDYDFFEKLGFFVFPLFPISLSVFVNRFFIIFSFLFGASSRFSMFGYNECCLYISLMMKLVPDTGSLMELLYTSFVVLEARISCCFILTECLSNDDSPLSLCFHLSLSHSSISHNPSFPSVHALCPT